MTKSYRKTCKKCGYKNTKKDGTMRWRQRYKCKSCNHIWIWKSRWRKKIDKEKLYEDRSLHKQTYKELWEKHWLTSRTIQKYLDWVWIVRDRGIVPTEIILLIDTTYFGKIWLMVFKEKSSKKILRWEIVTYETNEAYKRWVYKLQEEWWIIKAIVCDWRRWLLWWFGWIPTQMCHFHQIQIVRRNIRKNPILEENKELKKIVNRLPRTDKEWFRMELDRWYREYHKFIQEKWVTNVWKSYYIHKRTRTAYYSLKRNLEYLFIYQDYLWELDIPNTTNGLEWMFWQLKYKVTLHRWLREDRKLKLILYLLNSR